jgi:hypothetical protein
MTMILENEMGGFDGQPGRDAMQRMNASINKWKKPSGRAWGHFNPALQDISNVSGCALYFTPQKYWPEGVAQEYIGGKKVFGMLRNPYERLVAMFRGTEVFHALHDDYANDFKYEYVKTCDVNNGIKDMMTRYIQEIQNGNPFWGTCSYLPQAEFFDGPYGITVPVDNMKFPDSVNKLYQEHGYDDHVRTPQDIFHVTGCPEVWSADLDEETKAMVRQVYARDFELICKHFGQCDDHMDDCISGVPNMCPLQVCKGERVCATRNTKLDLLRK